MRILCGDLADYDQMEFVSVWPLRAQTIRGSSSSAFMFAFSNTVANLPGL
jgi:hypothetical protein